MRGRDMAEQILAMMVFRILGETIGFMSKTKFYDILEVGKNCFYRLLARPEMDWRILLLSMARRFQNIVRKEKAEETNAPKCYIIDDTTVSKTGLHFEGLSRVFDHVLCKCVLVPFIQGICKYGVRAGYGHIYELLAFMFRIILKHTIKISDQE